MESIISNWIKSLIMLKCSLNNICIYFLNIHFSPQNVIIPVRCSRKNHDPSHHPQTNLESVRPRVLKLLLFHVCVMNEENNVK